MDCANAVMLGNADVTGRHKAQDHFSEFLISCHDVSLLLACVIACHVENYTPKTVVWLPQVKILLGVFPYLICILCR